MTPDFQTITPWILFSLCFFLLYKSVRSNRLLNSKLDEASQEIKEKIHTLEENSKQLQSVIEHMNEAIVTVKTDYRILFHNRPFQEKFSPNRKIQDGEMFDMVIRNIELNTMLQNIFKTKQPEKKVIEITVESQRRVVEAQSVFVPERSGLVVIVFYDLTEIRESEKMKRDFITNASHQLKTPLTAIQGYSETLLEDAEIDVKIRQDFLAKIKNKSIEAADLVSKLLKLSKLESGAGNINYINIDVEKTILDVVRKFEAILKRQRVHMTHEFQNQSSQIQTDLPLFQLITENLMENAIKYSKPEGNIHIQVQKTGEGVQVQIKDEGIGIPEADLPRVFERFFRSHNAENHSHDGTGIGMAMVKSALDRLGGKIDVSSDQGKGTTITFALPNAPKELHV
jgi:two-component system phosphate regulon sensor histidine kinase PhoR